MRVLKWMLLVVCVAGVLLPCIAPAREAFAGRDLSYPRTGEYPPEVRGLSLREVPMGKLERAFADGFPGWTAHLTDGERQIVLRRVTRGTRLLHSSSYCFRGAGFEVRPLPMHVDAANRVWSCFEASRGADGILQRFVVRERIVDGVGNAWTDPSAWYWAALMERTRGPWWAITLIERQ